MKTQKSELNFNKSSVTELNDKQLLEVDGGTTAGCIALTKKITTIIIGD